MGATLRATRALVLLAGFYLLGFILLGALVAIDWTASQHTAGAAGLKIWILSALLAIPIVQGMFTLRAPQGDGPDGVPVTEQQEPSLWAVVRSLAEQTGTHAPDEIRLVGEVNAAVSEEARLLGLRPGKRRLLIGLPLMTGLSEPQLMAVLAHEFGHYSNHDTRLSAINRRGWTQVTRTVAALHERADKKAAKERARLEKKEAARASRDGEEAREVDTGFAGLSYRLAALPFKAYGHLYIRCMLGTMRRQEYAADLTAARITGRDATSSALREIPVLDAAFGFYMQSYATLGTGAGLLPPPGEVFGGLRHLLVGRAGELAEMRRSMPEEEPSPYDSHPPIADRVARIEQLPYDGRSLAGARPSLALLSDPARLFAELEHAALTPAARQLRRAPDWQHLVHESMAQYADASAEPFRQAVREVQGGDGSLSTALDAIEAGRLWQIAERLPVPEEADAEAATGRATREFTRPVLRKALSSLVAGELVQRGWAHWELSWTESAKLRMPDGYEEGLKSALDQAVADVPDTRALRQMFPPTY
ncbi:M48 family metallopeptidase [Streptomyces sp. V3I7]|uniref:M48 family metallopeptidase n=1 Tax=Streptomyces sp. V3I7 TaxID=3042278 RepID=UPI002786951D|nr:M48 family metallopeptidase [Streptomyces sp. V3I7]MDQ0992651.1 Zn-dependent protease with chaperone function [Streptomyces sp. V3I7]